MSTIKNPSRRSTSRLTLTPITEQIFAAYEELRRRHGFGPAPRHREGIWLCDETGRLVLGAGLFPDHAYCFAEDLVTHPEVSTRIRRDAIVLAARYFISYCAMRQLTPRMTVTHRGLAKLLAKNGFKGHQVAHMMGIPPEVHAYSRPRKKARAEARSAIPSPVEDSHASARPTTRVAARAGKSKP